MVLPALAAADGFYPGQVNSHAPLLLSVEGGHFALHPRGNIGEPYNYNAFSYQRLGANAPADYTKRYLITQTMSFAPPYGQAKVSIYNLTDDLSVVTDWIGPLSYLDSENPFGVFGRLSGRYHNWAGTVTVTNLDIYVGAAAAENADWLTLPPLAGDLAERRFFTFTGEDGAGAGTDWRDNGAGAVRNNAYYAEGPLSFPVNHGTQDLLGGDGSGYLVTQFEIKLTAKGGVNKIEGKSADEKTVTTLSLDGLDAGKVYGIRTVTHLAEGVYDRYIYDLAASVTNAASAEKGIPIEDSEASGVYDSQLTLGAGTKAYLDNFRVYKTEEAGESDGGEPRGLLLYQNDGPVTQEGGNFRTAALDQTIHASEGLTFQYDVDFSAMTGDIKALPTPAIPGGVYVGQAANHTPSVIAVLNNNFAVHMRQTAPGAGFNAYANYTIAPADYAKKYRIAVTLSFAPPHGVQRISIYNLTDGVTVTDGFTAPFSASGSDSAEWVVPLPFASAAFNGLNGNYNGAAGNLTIENIKIYAENLSLPRYAESMEVYDLSTAASVILKVRADGGRTDLSSCRMYVARYSGESGALLGLSAASGTDGGGGFTVFTANRPAEGCSVLLWDADFTPYTEIIKK
jgi:hypothetical protein